MLRKVILFVCLFLPTLVYSQTATVTGHALYPSNSAPANASVCFSLLNFKPNLPRVVGTGVLIQQTNFCITVSTADGSFSTVLFENPSITPANTSWRVDYLWNGIQQASATYNVNASPFNLDVATPLASLPIATASTVVTNSFICAVPVAATTWTCTHNLNDSFVVTEAFDPTNKLLWPDTITNTTPNVTVLTFVTAQAGTARIVSTAAINIATSQPNAVITNPVGNQTINAGFSFNVLGPLNATGGGSLGGTFGGTPTWAAQHTFSSGAIFSGVTTLSAPLFLTTGATIEGQAGALWYSVSNPTIAGAGCGGSAASIVTANGTAAFKINVGTTPSSACTFTMPAAATGWNVSCNDITTQSTSVFVQKQTGAESTTSVTITNFNDVAVATAFAASDVLKCIATAD